MSVQPFRSLGFPATSTREFIGHQYVLQAHRFGTCSRVLVIPDLLPERPVLEAIVVNFSVEFDNLHLPLNIPVSVPAVTLGAPVRLL